jgi:hypothetical protein
MTMQTQEIKRLEQKNPIVAVAVEMGLSVKNNMAPCFRQDRHGPDDPPSLFFNVAQNSFLCRECPDVGGGVIDFIVQLKGWNRQEAIDWLVHRNEFDLETRQLYYIRGKRRE